MQLEDFLIDRPIAYQANSNKWNERGFLILRDFIPSEIVDNYTRHGPYLYGTPQEATAYMRNTDLLRLCTFQELADKIELLIGEPGGVHLNLLGWTSTERAVHADSYLSGDFLEDRYVAAWMALGEIDSDCGPFAYLEGSHLWGFFNEKKFVSHCLETGEVTGTEVASGSWYKKTESILTNLVEEKREREGIEWQYFTANKGDCLLWCSRLFHKGSLAKVPGKERRAAIAHYSGIHHRPDMPQAVKSVYGGYYFPIGR